MESFKHFLETSTIHGLNHIATTRKWARKFWIFVACSGFGGAIYLIQQSFGNWKESPISTTIKTLPISEIKFPNFTICAPKEDLLNLNI